MRVYELHREQVVPRPVADVFPFFAAAENLNALTPPWLEFRILTPLPIRMAAGTRLDYRIRWRGIPLRWQTLIETWEPGVRFVDTQVRGPYRLWHHTHTFEPLPDGGTRLTDHVLYALPLGPLGRVVHALLVRRDVATIFDYRAARIAALFGVEAGR